MTLSSQHGRSIHPKHSAQFLFEYSENCFCISFKKTMITKWQFWGIFARKSSYIKVHLTKAAHNK